MGQYSSKIVNRIRTSVRNTGLRSWIRGVVRSPNLFGGRYTIEDNTEVVIYTDHPDVFTSYTPRRPLRAVSDKRDSQVSFIATAFNERTTVEMLVRGIFSQTRLPDEIIITDTGSSDGTVELLEKLAGDSPVPIMILALPEGNIAQGRNLAISNARFPIIAVSDFGCDIPKDWLENLIAPFEDNPQIQVSFGRYEAVDTNKKRTKWLQSHELDQLSPQNHLPSAVSIAFQKQAWEGAGGYPEWLSMTGEDTYFALELKRSTKLWAFVPEAVVLWIAPQSLSQYLQKSFLWSTGDGEVGTTAQSYRWALLKMTLLYGAILVIALATMLIILSESLLIKIVAGVLVLTGFAYVLVLIRKRRSNFRDELMLAGVYTAEVLGFVRGLSRRREVDQKRMSGVKGAFFILSGVPIDDTGGGARWTQITLELLRRQFQVFFINKFPKYESKELHLEFRHPNLVTLHVSELDWPILLEKYQPALSKKPVFGLLELPLADFLPSVDRLHSLNGVVVYDLLDAWDSSLGGQWYDPKMEQQIIKSSDVLIATAPGLVKRLASQSNKTVNLVPNAVNDYLFNPERSYLLPSDFPRTDWNIIYIGALWGEWFDWDLLEKISNHYPEAGLIVIGDTMGRDIAMPEGVQFLGLKPQQELPAYLNFSQVAIVPWKVNLITQMTSPLKVYEYIAMNKPVVAPMIDSLKDVPGVFQAIDQSDFIDKVGSLRSFNPSKAEMTKFIDKNNWRCRVDQILGLANQARDAAEDQE